MIKAFWREASLRAFWTPISMSFSSIQMRETQNQWQSLVLSSWLSVLSRLLRWISNVSGLLCRLQYSVKSSQAMDGAFSFPQLLFHFASSLVSFTMNLAWWLLFSAVFVVFTFQCVSFLLQLEKKLYSKQSSQATTLEKERISSTRLGTSGCVLELSWSTAWLCLFFRWSLLSRIFIKIISRDNILKTVTVCKS